MFIIVCKLEEVYYVPEFFEDGMYPREIAKAKKFLTRQEAEDFMHDKAYDQNDWFKWEIDTV